MQALADRARSLLPTARGDRSGRCSKSRIDLGLQPLAGFAEPQHAWRVVGESEVVSRFEALRLGTTPLVGRDEELDLLLRHWQQANLNEGRVVLLSGEPGIGKSRLTAALSQRIESEPHTRIRYFCSPHHQDSALYPFIVQLERAAGFTRDDTETMRLDKLEALLGAGAEPGDIALIAEILSLSGGERFPPLDGAAAAAAGAGTATAGLDDLRGPALDRSDLARAARPCGQKIADLPVLLVATNRPEFQQPRVGGHDSTPQC